MTTDGLVEALQCDRDAAMAMLNHAFRNAPDDCTDGVEFDDIAQAFAEHRVAVRNHLKATGGSSNG